MTLTTKDVEMEGKMKKLPWILLAVLVGIILLSAGVPGELSLRDYFAAEWMNGYASDHFGRNSMQYDDVAARAYSMADAMLRARSSR